MVGAATSELDANDPTEQRFGEDLHESRSDDAISGVEHRHPGWSAGRQVAVVLRNRPGNMPAPH
jgi:hypothetical protein